MKYEYKLILRTIIALLIRPEIFYSSFLFVTMAFPYVILKILSYDVQLVFSDSILMVGGTQIQFVEACMATTAYYLLALLILTTKDIGLKKSIKMFLIGALLIFVMNLLRITLLVMAVVNMGLNWFNAIHMLFWYIISTFYVLLIWIFLIRFYKVKNIPIYSDIKYLLSELRKKK
jgi:exosortase/archaeosortase family protein